jgi:hypothetical protein
MKHFLIKYRFQTGSQADWHKDISAFIAAIDSNPALKGRIGYRCFKVRDSADYYHLASPKDDQVPKDLQARDFFSSYTAKTRLVSNGGVEVLPLEVIAETA